MKALHIFAVIFSMVFSSFSFAEQETLPVTPIKNLKVEEVNFDNLPKESNVGNLAGLVKEEKETSLLDSLSERIRNRAILYPYAEGIAYVNGQLCHVGNYSQSIIYTVLEGPYYGTQTTTAYDGVVLYVNYDYKLKYTPGGVIFYHYYSDS